LKYMSISLKIIIRVYLKLLDLVNFEIPYE